jgi:hypothetical protein
VCRSGKRWKYDWSEEVHDNCLVLRRGSESIDNVVGEEEEEEEGDGDDRNDGDDGDDGNDGDNGSDGNDGDDGHDRR